MAVINAVDHDLGKRVGREELLIKTAVLSNVLAHLLLHVELTAINLVCDSCPKVLQTVHPWQWVATEIYIR